MDVFVKKHFPEIHQTYLAYSHNIFRADLFRLLVLYQMGGVYVDLDMECIKSLDHLFDKYVTDKEAEVVLSYEPPNQSKETVKVFPLYHATFLAAKPGSTILDTIIKDCLKKGTDHHWNHVLFVTGPIAITKSLGPLLPDKRVKVLDYKIVNPVLDISNPAILRFYKRKSLQMLLTRKFYPETYMLHYWHQTYFLRKPILLLSRAELEWEFRKSKSLIYCLKNLIFRWMYKIINTIKRLFRRFLK